MGLSNKFVAGFFVLLLTTFFFCDSVRADNTDDDEEIEDPQTSTQDPSGASDSNTYYDYSEDDDTDNTTDNSTFGLKASTDLTTHVLFPNYPNYKFPVQTEITMLVGLHNKGNKAFNISTIGAYLHSPYDFSYHIQNFSHREVGVVLEPGSQVSIEYNVNPDKNLEPLEYWFSSFILYNDSDDKQYKTTFVNGTLELVEKTSDVNFRRIFSYFFALAVSGLVGYIAYNLLFKPKHAKNEGNESSGGGWGTKVYKQKQANKRSLKKNK